MPFSALSRADFSGGIREKYSRIPSVFDEAADFLPENFTEKWWMAHKFPALRSLLLPEYCMSF